MRNEQILESRTGMEDTMHLFSVQYLPCRFGDGNGVVLVPLTLELLAESIYRFVCTGPKTINW